MSLELSEEEMRCALFGSAELSVPPLPTTVQEPAPEMAIVPVSKPVLNKKSAKALTPRLKVTLRVGNEFEGQTFEMTHEADTLSTLLAEQEATKAARKKYRYVEVISVESM